MRHKKSSKPEPETSQFAPFDPATEAKVDAMMAEEPTGTPIVVGDETGPSLVVIPAGQTEAEAPAENTEPKIPSHEPADDIAEASVMDTDQQPAVPETDEPTADKEPELESTSVTPDGVDPTLDAAVDDITHTEADTVLAAEDAARAQTPAKEAKPQHPVRAFFARWWQNPIARWATILILLGGILAAAVVPPSRYFLLNSAGVRSSASVTVIDQSTGQPLQNVSVNIGGQSAKTNEKGFARLSEMKLGTQDMLVSRVAFAPLKESVTLGWGSNPLGSVELKATGVQYVLQAADYVSGKPLAAAKAANGDAIAQADAKGKIVLTLEAVQADTVTITVTADGYRTETLTLPADTTEPHQVHMVPAQPVVYVTKQTGTYDLYKVDADGANKQLLLKGTGSERPSMGIMTSSDGNYVAFVSSREKRYDSENYLLDTLTLINAKTGKTQTIDQAQSIQLVAWRGQNMVYRAAYAAPSAATNQRQRLISYNVDESARNVLANGNYFVGIYPLGSQLFYAVSTNGNSDSGQIVRMKFDGSDKKVIYSGPVWTLVRTKPNELYTNANNAWYRYDVAKDEFTKQAEPDEAYEVVDYYPAPNETYGAVIEQRDGKGVLIKTDAKTDTQSKVIASSKSIYGPVTWLNDTTVSYYVDSGSETAIFVASTEGGEPKQISSATLVSGGGAGYY